MSHSLLTTAGRSELIERLDLEWNETENRGRRTTLIEDVRTETGQTFQTEGEVELEALFKAMLLRVGHDAIGQLLGLGRSHLRQIERHQMTVHADLWRRVGGDVQIAAIHLQHSFEQIA